jgi:thymidylate kinase
MMHNTSLIFVERIMGAGKSTTAWFLTQQLQRHGIAARFLLEGPTAEEPDHPLRVATELPHPNGVWLDVTVQQYMERSLQKWHRFVQEALQSAVVTICDGLLFHGNMTDLLLMNAEPDVLFRYVAQVLESIQRLNPVLIYFYHADVTQALRAVCDARGSEWEAYQVNWKVRSPYGVQRSLQGFTGLVQLYRVYRALCDDFFAQLALPKLAIRNDGDWATYYQEILTFLHLPPAPPEVHRTV